MKSLSRARRAAPIPCAALLLAPILTSILVPIFTPSRALAQPRAAGQPAKSPSAAAVSADAPPPPTVEERAAIKKKAAAAYQRGRELIETQGACDAQGSAASTTEALNAFLDSLRLVPKPGTTFLIAVCHQALDHIEEALFFYEAYLRLPDIPEELKLEAQKAVVGLRARVGTIVIEQSERGAKIVVNGRARGEFPSPTPIIAIAGKHLVQVYRAGFAPFEATVGVLPGEVTKVAARLTALQRLGRLEVKERSGKVVDVIVDGAVVGRTPWEGQLAEGEHGVVLRGDKYVGSPPASVTIAGDKPAVLTLAAERLDATLRIVPEPSGATLLIDKAFVGPGAFDGRLKPGEHEIKAVADGFVAATQKVKLGAGADETIHITLTRQEQAALWQKPVDVAPDKPAAAGSSPTWPWVVGGAGVIALGAAAAFGIDGLLTTSKLDALCNGDLSRCEVPNQQQADAVALVNGHKNRDLALFIGFAAVGVAGVTAGLVGILSGSKGPEKGEKDTAGLRLVPVAGPGFGGAALGGNF